MPLFPEPPEHDPMFNAERLLGQLLGGQLLGGQRAGGKWSTGTKVKLGVGLLGLAAAAFQHYSQQQGSQAGANPLVGAGMPPPPPTGASQPPPPPGAMRSEEAMLLLRAMITAAHADGLIDAGEREAIVGRARAAGLDADTLQALEAEIRAPLTIDQLAARTPPALRDEVYAAALVAITADTEAERGFLDAFAAALALDAAQRRDIHSRLGFA
jgi:uncharacterized membrane protein YebE (DUF533 family)